MSSSIQELVTQALETGYLTVDAEERLRKRLHGQHCEREDLHAFMRLQMAAMRGDVQQQSRLSMQSATHKTEQSRVTAPGSTARMSVA